VKKNKTFGLPRANSLKSEKIIEFLFNEGASMANYPIRLVYSEFNFPNDVDFLVGFSVPKKKFKKAVDRNRIKRLMRESFRLQQNQLQLKQKTVMMWLYTGKEIPDFDLIYQKTGNIINKLNHKKIKDRKNGTA